MKKDDYTYIDKMVANAKRLNGSVDRRFLNSFKNMKNVELPIDDPDSEEDLQSLPRYARAFSL